MGGKSQKIKNVKVLSLVDEMFQNPRTQVQSSMLPPRLSLSSQAGLLILVENMAIFPASNLTTITLTPGVHAIKLFL